LQITAAGDYIIPKKATTVAENVTDKMNNNKGCKAIVISL